MKFTTTAVHRLHDPERIATLAAIAEGTTQGIKAELLLSVYLGREGYKIGCFAVLDSEGWRGETDLRKLEHVSVIDKPVWCFPCPGDTVNARMIVLTRLSEAAIEGLLDIGSADRVDAALQNLTKCVA